MAHETGVWIDHKKAVIVSCSNGHVETRTLQSGVGGHGHYSGSQDGGGEKKYEERHDLHLDRFYDEVIKQLGQPASLLLLGPGEAKLQLRERLGRSKAATWPIIAIETADRLTDPQIVARVREHYGIER